MWTTLALALVLQAPPTQGGSLTITNDQLTYGYLGPRRSDDRFLPGDVYALTFEVRNMTFDGAGKASYSIGMEIIDGKGQSRFKQIPRNLQATNFLGGQSLYSVAYFDIPPEAKPGEYTLKLTVEDRAAKTKATLERKGTVVAPDFGLVRVGLSADHDGAVPRPPVAVLGETLHINFLVAHFDRDKDSKHPHVEVALRLLDSKGQPTMAQPLSGKMDRESNIPEKLGAVPMQFGVTLNRLGQYTVELSATDRVSGKTARVTFPIRVVALN